MAVESLQTRYRRYSAYLQPIITDPAVRNYFGLIASVILITILIIFALSPTINIVLSLQKKIADQRQIITTLDEKTNNLISAQQAYSQIEPQLSLLDKALPANPSPWEIINTIQLSASDSALTVYGLQFKTMYLSSIQPKQATGVIGSLPVAEFSLAVTGGSEQLRYYLGGLENDPRYIRMKSLSFTFDPLKTKTSVNVEGQGYYYVQ